MLMSTVWKMVPARDGKDEMVVGDGRGEYCAIEV